jgi:hypothetical protein
MKVSWARGTSIAWASVFVAALFAAACGKDSTGPASSFAGGWEGQSSQGYPLAFYVSDQGLPLIAVEYRLVGTTCTEQPSVWFAREPPDTAYAVAADAFSASMSGTVGTITVTGSFTPATQASGTIAVNSTRCGGTLNATWTATKATAATANLAGTWTGTYRTSLVATTAITFSITQNGSALSGTYVSANGGAGTATGTVSGKVGTFTLTQTTSGCTGSFAGHAAFHAAPDLLYLAWSGNDCLGSHTRAGGLVSRP